MTRYKLEDKKVERSVFVMNSDISHVLNIWEKAVKTHQKDFESANASVIFSISKGKFAVLTETNLLFKLYNEVKDNNLIKSTARIPQPLEAL